jgi:fluoroquinolone transport system ATP-binding protein
MIMIQVNNLGFQYPGENKPTLKGLNFNIEAGEIFGFLGPSGAGKSTTQKVLYKVYHQYSGELLINGKNLKNWGAEYLAMIGVGFELPNHYEKLTGRENLELFASFYPKATRRNLAELFELVDLADAIDKPVSRYSKGMKVRLNFLRAIQHDPQILFLDEPTSGLDPVNAQKIKSCILDLKSSGKTIFITTHHMETADQLCDRVAFIIDGSLRAIDSPQNLKKQYGQELVQVTLENDFYQQFPLLDLGSNTDFLQFIQTGKVKQIHSLEASLEEVFIKITGQSLTK